MLPARRVPLCLVSSEQGSRLAHGSLVVMPSLSCRDFLNPGQSLKQRHAGPDLLMSNAFSSAADVVAFCLWVEPVCALCRYRALSELIGVKCGEKRLPRPVSTITSFSSELCRSYCLCQIASPWASYIVFWLFTSLTSPKEWEHSIWILLLTDKCSSLL